MHKPESVLENNNHKILWDSEVQKNHLTPDRRPDQKKTYHQVDFAIPADHRGIWK